jgi:hypothetical protein
VGLGRVVAFALHTHPVLAAEILINKGFKQLVVWSWPGVVEVDMFTRTKNIRMKLVTGEYKVYTYYYQVKNKRVGEKVVQETVDGTFVNKLHVSDKLLSDIMVGRIEKTTKRDEDDEMEYLREEGNAMED